MRIKEKSVKLNQINLILIYCDLNMENFVQ